MPSEAQAGESRRDADFRPVILLTGVFFFNFIGRIIMPPFLMGIEEEFAVSHLQAGQLFLIMSLGFGLSLLLSGFAARALEHRKTIILSAFAVGAGMLLLSRVESFGLFRVALFCTGIGCGLYLPSGISTVTSLLAKEHWGKGLAIHEMAPNLSFILAPAVAAAVEGLLTWRSVFAGFGLASLLMALIFLRFGRGGRFSGEAPRPAVVALVAGKAQFWVLGGLFGLAVSATFGIYSMLPLFLVDVHGFESAAANGLVSSSRVPCLLMALAAGWIVDRIGPRKTVLMALGGSGLITVLLGLSQGWPLKAAVLMQPILAVGFFPAGFTAISRTFPFHVRNVAVSFIIPLAVFFGTGLVPTALGWFADVGRFALGFISLGCVLCLGMNLVHFLRFQDSEEST